MTAASPHRSVLGGVAGVVGCGALAACFAASPFPSEGGVLVVVGASAATLVLARRWRSSRGARVARPDANKADGGSVGRSSGERDTLALVPWGVLVETGKGSRALRWAAIRAVEMNISHGRDGVTPFTRFSHVRITTDSGELEGFAAGAAPLDRLVAHLASYASEQATPVSLALHLEPSTASGRTDGAPLLEAHEPVCVALLAAVRAYLGSADAYADLSLPSGTYRTSGTKTASAATVDRLRVILTSREEDAVDHRPFAAAVAAELDVGELIDELVTLVDSPHPVVASVAKAAALRLGVATSRVGSLEEVASFLAPADLDALAAWSREPRRDARLRALPPGASAAAGARR